MDTHVDFTRRHGLQAAALGSLAAAFAAGGSALAAPPHRERGRTPRVGERAHVAVTVATAWVGPNRNRPGIDDPSLSRPVDLDAWNRAMEDTEVRRWLTGQLETQAVLGSEVIVDEIRGEWARVVVTHQPTPRDPRGYPGWVPLRQLVVDDEFAHAARTRALATVTATRTHLYRNPSLRHPQLAVSFNTILPVIRRTGRSIEVAVPGGGSRHLALADAVVRAQGEKPPAPSVEDVIATAERFLGLRYLWAGVSGYGFDCSGFTLTALGHHGIRIHRDAGPQKNNSGLTPVAREDLQRGDLVFFASRPGSESIRHVAFYVGEDRILHAPNAARSVEQISLSGYDTTGDYAGAGRWTGLVD